MKRNRLAMLLVSTPQTKKLMDALKEILDRVITTKSTLKLNYQGNERHVIPLVSGQLKNGKEALLCYKIIGEHNGSMDIAIRLYHWSKISQAEETGIEMPLGSSIDYYLTKQFKSVYSKI